MGCELSGKGGVFAPVTNAFVDKHWQVLGWDVDHEPQSGRNFGCVFIFPFLLLMIPVYPVWMIVALFIVECQERLLRRRLKAAGRYLSWEEIQRRMQSLESRCTLIQQIGNLRKQRVWWTHEDVGGKTPLPLPGKMELLDPGGSNHPFISWCESEYFVEPGGKAFLTELPDEPLKSIYRFDDIADQERVALESPMLGVVSTGYLGGKELLASSKFQKLLGSSVESSLPQLLVGITDENQLLRRLCIESIALIGERAEAAVPVLKSRLYYGHEEDRHRVARTLSKLGATGLQVLNEALLAGDPRIRGSARSAINQQQRITKPIVRDSVARIPVNSKKRAAEVRNGWVGIAVYFASLTGVIGLVIASGWYLGTLVTVGIFLGVSASAVSVFIWWYYRRIRQRVKKVSAQMAALSVIPQLKTAAESQAIQSEASSGPSSLPGPESSRGRP